MLICCSSLTERRQFLACRIGNDKKAALCVGAIKSQGWKHENDFEYT